MCFSCFPQWGIKANYIPFDESQKITHTLCSIYKCVSVCVCVCVSKGHIIYIYAYIHYITLHYTILHYITLHYITLHYTTLYYITLPIPPLRCPAADAQVVNARQTAGPRALWLPGVGEDQQDRGLRTSSGHGESWIHAMEIRKQWRFLYNMYISK
jgi:hypothetical protein